MLVEGTAAEMAAPTQRGGAMGVTARLVLCAGFAKELETQAHLIHFNYEAENFLAVHEFLKGQYEAHLGQFDALSEFVRAQDFLMPMCSCGLKEAAGSFVNVTSYEASSMLMTYLQNLEQMAGMARGLEREAADAGAIDVQNYAAELYGASKKAAWFLKATLRGC